MFRRWIQKARRMSKHFRDIQVQEWINDVEPFFIQGMGRSGTKFLSSMLGKCPDTLVFHEPLREDFAALVEAHKSNDSALRYFTDFRLERMQQLSESHDIRHYGEVNSNLRFHTKAIMTALPKARLLHLVRDGREVVRSVMERSHYTPETTAGHHHVHPLSSDPLYERWDTLSRFEKVCWLWTDANRRLAEDVPRSIVFESLISDYDYFKENLLDYLGLELSETQWSEKVCAPTNITKEFSFPNWQQWDTNRREAFDAICGEQMARFGYIQDRPN